MLVRALCFWIILYVPYIYFLIFIMRGFRKSNFYQIAVLLGLILPLQLMLCFGFA